MFDLTTIQLMNANSTSRFCERIGLPIRCASDGEIVRSSSRSVSTVSELLGMSFERGLDADTRKPKGPVIG